MYHYRSLELVLEQGEIVLEVRSGHELPGPAGHLGDHPGHHVHDQAERAVEEFDEVKQDRIVLRGSVLLAEVHAALVLLGGKQTR